MLGWPEIVLILVVLMLIFGPSKMPEIARTLGEAFREFKKASEDLQKTIEAPASQTVSPQTNLPQATPQTSPPQVNIPKNKEDEDLIIQLAKKLGINTEGKDIQTIMNEIEEKVKINKDESKS